MDTWTRSLVISLCFRHFSDRFLSDIERCVIQRTDSQLPCAKNSGLSLKKICLNCRKYSLYKRMCLSWVAKLH